MRAISRYFPLPRQAGHFRKDFQVHHIVDDDREIPPFAGVPAAGAAHDRAETGAEFLGPGFHHLQIGGIPGQAVPVAETAVHLETDVVVGVHPYDPVQFGSLAFCHFQHVGIAGVLINQPERAGEESAGPIVQFPVLDLAFFEGDRHFVGRYPRVERGELDDRPFENTVGGLFNRTAGSGAGNEKQDGCQIKRFHNALIVLQIYELFLRVRFISLIFANDIITGSFNF